MATHVSSDQHGEFLDSFDLFAVIVMATFAIAIAVAIVEVFFFG